MLTQLMLSFASSPAQGDCEASDTCYAMSPMCPPAKWGSASQRSPCGMPMLHSQPDGYVNEEW